jgi:hypothetical protein
MAFTTKQEVTKRCRLSWLTNRALVYEPKWAESGWSGGEHLKFGDPTPYLTCAILKEKSLLAEKSRGRHSVLYFFLVRKTQCIEGNFINITIKKGNQAR